MPLPTTAPAAAHPRSAVHGTNAAAAARACAEVPTSKPLAEDAGARGKARGNSLGMSKGKRKAPRLSALAPPQASRSLVQFT